jgi:hypothetical protein
MHFPTILTLALAASSSAGSIPSMDISSGLTKRSHNYNREFSRALSGFERRSVKSRRGPAPSNNPAAALPDTPATGPATAANLKEWNQKTAQACNTAISQLTQASNPSGLGVCYNLPFLNKKTGVFQAELRIFNVSAPSAPWEGVSRSDISVAFGYQGATVSQANGLVQRDVDHIENEFVARLVAEEDVHELDARQSSGTPPQIKVLSYVGKIDAELLPATK